MAKIKIFKSPRTLNYFELTSLENILSACELINKPNIYDLIDSVQEKYIVCACDNEGEIIGFMAVENEDYNLCINTLYVHYSDRNKGVASALLKTATHLAKEKNKDTLDLVVKINNENARRLYKKSHYIEDSLVSNNVVHMVKYTQNTVYIIGGILHELEKLKKVEGNTQNIVSIENIEDLSIFYKYLRTEDKDSLLNKIFKSDIFKLAYKISLQIKEENVDFSIIKNLLFKINNNLPLEKELSCFDYEDKRVLKLALLSLSAKRNFENQEIIEEKLEEFQENVK